MCIRDRSVALSIMKAYESNQDEYYESLSGEGVVAHEMYLPADGQFSYSINRLAQAINSLLRMMFLKQIRQIG